MENETLTWIHLSDLHMEPEDSFNRGLVLEALWRDIENFIDRGIQPDFIAFTGDVAYHGTAQEYELAVKEFFEPLLSLTQIGKERLFIVPGNHDVDRNKTNMLRNPIPTIQTEDDIRELLQSPDRREILLTPFSSYENFVESYLSSQKLENPGFAYSQKIQKGEFAVLIVGLNSAWLSGFHRNISGEVDDFGKLALGEFQVLATRNIDAHLRIALVHHPMEWLMETDRTVVEDRLMRDFCVLLRGHLHRSDVLSVSSLAGHLLVIPSGAVFDGRNSPNVYNIAQVDLITGSGLVYFRRYSNRRNEWQKDIESTGEEANGQVTVRLPKFWYAATVKAGKPETSKNVRSYTRIFTEDCRRDMSSLGLTEDNVIELVQGEFQSHLNYFRFDLEDYPLPVRTNYIVYLNKVQQRIEFRRIVPCTRNEAKLSRWNDVLAVYRRATRMAYREDPTKILSIRGLVGRVHNLHLDVGKRIEKYYREFYGIEADPGLRRLQKEQRQAQDVMPEDTVPATTGDLRRMGDEIAFHLLESYSASKEALKIIESLDFGDISADNAIGMIVVAFERSLQHIHKIILLYPPVGE